MILPIFVDDVIRVQEKLRSANRVLTNCRFRSGKQKEQIDFQLLSPAERDALRDVIYKGAEKKDKHYTVVKRRYDEWHSMLTNPDTSKPLSSKKLKLLPAAIKAWFADKPRKWVFIQGWDGSMNPYFITNSTYNPAYYDQYKNYYPAKVQVMFRAWVNGSQVGSTATFYAQDLDKPVGAIFSAKNIMPETEDGVTKYLENYSRYVEIRDKVGLQLEAIGMGEKLSSNSWYDSGYISMVREGYPTKVVMEDQDDEDATYGKRSRSSSSSSEDTFVNDGFWEDIPNRNGMAGLNEQQILELKELHEDDEDEDIPDIEPNRVELPIHTYVKVFDLDKHEYLNIHVGNLNDYPWDKTLINKLVIKDEDKQLIDLLMDQTGAKMEDIIRGKMGGVIVLATGQPGIGKTLTAEVFSEAIERPLYTVQCSQLGLNVNEIEKNLQDILNRAARWNAILLIDEADVYIRKRGDDIQQNAIVGVFLRLIEYYKGILFMTSNRGDSIDDAIISRASAWIKYEVPDADNLKKIFEVLGKQYSAEFTSKELDALVKEFNGVSGRTVRNILKLARMLAGDNKVTVDMVRTASKYQALETTPGATAAAAKS